MDRVQHDLSAVGGAHYVVCHENNISSAKHRSMLHVLYMCSEARSGVVVLQRNSMDGLVPSLPDSLRISARHHSQTEAWQPALQCVPCTRSVL